MHAPWNRPADDSLAWLLLSWRGRIDRRTWWLWSVAALIGLAAYATMVLRIAGVSAAGTEHAVNLLLLWPFLALSAKRWHDRDKPGWWVLVGLIPVVGWLWLLVENGLLAGTPGPNRFGDVPAP
ncbi:MAG TPA: DUF805 domain-containing protein [Burkholderiaceae bacterium]|nr:DUF805 domain-containing protein [Burkholderiaceae bacterium]